MPSPFQDFVDRLLLGSPEMVSQTLSNRAQAQRQRELVEERARAAEQSQQWHTQERVAGERATAERSKADILTRIREQARETQAKEDREAGERGSLARTAQFLRTGQPSGEPSPPPAPEELLQFKGGESTYKHLYPQPETPKPYTLGPGQVRFKPGGVPEADVPQPDLLPKGLMEASMAEARLKRKAQSGTITPEEQVTLSEISAGLSRYSALGGDLAYQSGAGREGGRRSLPLKDRGNWINIKGLADPSIPLAFPAGTTETQAIEAGGFQISDKEKEALADLDRIAGVLTPLKELSSRVINATRDQGMGWQQTKGLAARVPGLRWMLEAEKTYLDSQKEFLATLARSLSGEKGVLTNEDRQVLVVGLPSFEDTAKVRDAKWAIIDHVIENARMAKLRWMFLDIKPSPAYEASKAALLDKLRQLSTPQAPSKVAPGQWIK